ncbi:hypothetical protein EAO72_32610 [Streptomyces sp. or43]|nr:hypothetical protein EAO72_32610 [Streptomyces sp. or43]
MLKTEPPLSPHRRAERGTRALCPDCAGCLSPAGGTAHRRPSRSPLTGGPTPGCGAGRAEGPGPAPRPAGVSGGGFRRVSASP